VDLPQQDGKSVQSPQATATHDDSFEQVDIHQDKGDMIARKCVVGHRTTKGGRYEGQFAFPVLMTF
jgi:hypothetical protein